MGGDGTLPFDKLRVSGDTSSLGPREKGAEEFVFSESVYKLLKQARVPTGFSPSPFRLPLGRLCTWTACLSS